MTPAIIIAALSLIATGSLAYTVAMRFRKGHGISILIPFRCQDPLSPRMKNVEWLKQYWATHLPGAEIIVGDDPDVEPFSKSSAVNIAASKAHGDIFVIVDADGYVSADTVLRCAEEIRHARKLGRKLWFIPYRQFYRLTEEASKYLLQSKPEEPYKFPSPPAASNILGDADPKIGHWYGAMIQIVPREAFETVGGWDIRFRGWGGEDHAAMRATDTLYGLHKTMPDQVLHIWHPMIGPQGIENWVHWKERMWAGQTESGINNSLSHRYYAAQGKIPMMRALVDEWHCKDFNCHDHRHHHHYHHHHHRQRPSI